MIPEETIDNRIQDLKRFGEAIRSEKEEIADTLVRSVGITISDKLWEVGYSADTLATFDQEKKLILGRKSKGDKSILIAYNDPVFSLATALGPAYLASEEKDKILLKYPITKIPKLSLMKEIIGDNLKNIEFFDQGGPEYIKHITKTDTNVVMLYGHHSWVEKTEPFFRASKQKVIFEGGSKNPFVVAEDADLEEAAETAYKNNILFSGQACFSSKRVFVHSSLYDQFIEKVKDLISNTKVGDPLDPETKIGANVSKPAVEAILYQIEQAKKDGATVYGANHYDIKVGDKDMTIIEPAIVYNGKPKLSVMKDETFGPVMAIQKYESEDDLYDAVLNSDYGLIFTIFGNLQDQNIQQKLAEAHGFNFHNDSMVDLLMNSEGWHNPWNGYGKSAWTWETLPDGTFSRSQGSEYFVRKFSENMQMKDLFTTKE